MDYTISKGKNTYQRRTGGTEMREEGKRRYLYNDMNERYKRLNRLMWICGLDILGVLIVYLAAKGAARSISLSTVYGNIVLNILFITADTVLFFRNKNWKHYKLVIVSEVGLEYLLIALQSDTTFINLTLIGMMITTVLFYDKGFQRNLLFAYSVIYLIGVIARGAKGFVVYDINELAEVIVIYMVFIILYQISVVGKRFSDDALGEQEEQAARQKEMLEDVLSISREVKDEAEKGKALLDRLYGSTSTVNQSMMEITEATGMTAQNVNEQNTMTQSIQEALDETVKCSGHMVEIAGESNKNIQTNIRAIEELKTQAENISRTNGEVTDSMEKLLQKTEEVKKIANIIFSISSQTNLLALNASIESARAGEAGRGFAVVAEQIRNLSEQTRQSTENISQIIGELNRNAGEVVEKVSSSVEAAGRQNEMIIAAAEDFRKLDGNIEELLGDIKEIDGKISHLSDSNNKIVESVSQLSAATQEITASADQASTITGENLENAQAAQRALETINQTTHRMEKYL